MILTNCWPKQISLYMDDFESLSQAPAEDNRSGSIHLFLALYLLVLAFFIVLVTISTREEIKSQAVKDSLTTTFATILPVRGEPAPFASRAGDFVGSPAFEGMITDVFSAAVSINKVTVIQPGSVMRVSMPSDSLFLSGESTLREAQHPLLDRIVAALSGRPAGLHHDLEFVLGVDVPPGRLPVAKSLELERAEAFVQALLSRGVPPDSVAVGVEPGDPAEIVMTFHIRSANDLRMRFEESAPKERN